MAHSSAAAVRSRYQRPLRAELGCGVLHDGDAEMLGLTGEMLQALNETLAGECPEHGKKVLRSTGNELGRSLAAHLRAELADEHAATIEELPGACVQAAVTEALARWGWGEVALNFERYGEGIVEAEVRNGTAPAVDLLAGVLSGLFSAWTGLELDCRISVNSGDDGTMAFAIGLPSRLALTGNG